MSITRLCPVCHEAAAQTSRAVAIAGRSQADSSRLRNDQAKANPRRAAQRARDPGEPNARQTRPSVAINVIPTVASCRPVRSRRNSPARFGTPTRKTVTSRNRHPRSSTMGRTARRSRKGRRSNAPNSASLSGTPDRWTSASQIPNPGGFASKVGSYGPSQGTLGWESQLAIRSPWRRYSPSSAHCQGWATNGREAVSQ
jgi:hypothetical protein